MDSDDPPKFAPGTSGSVPGMVPWPYPSGAAAGPGDGQILDLLISLTRSNLDTLSSPPSALSVPDPRKILYQALWTRYERDRKVEDLNEAIGIGIGLAAQTQPNTVERGFIWDTLASQMSALYEESAQVMYLDFAIGLGRKAIQEPFDSDLELSTRLGNLGYSLSARFRATHDPADLSESIEIGVRALHNTPEGNITVRLKALSNLSARYIERYHLDHSEKDRLEAERLCDLILSMTTPDDQHRVVALANLSDLYTDKSNCSSSNVEDAMRLVRLAADKLQPDASHRGQILAMLGSRVYSKYQQTKEVKYLDEAIAVYDEATSSPTNTRLDQLIILTKFAALLKESSEQTKAERIINKAISVHLILVDVPDIDQESRQALRLSLRTLYDLKFS